jgi:hypothetical protein
MGGPPMVTAGVGPYGQPQVAMVAAGGLPGYGQPQGGPPIGGPPGYGPPQGGPLQVWIRTASRRAGLRIQAASSGARTRTASSRAWALPWAAADGHGRRDGQMGLWAAARPNKHNPIMMLLIPWGTYVVLQIVASVMASIVPILVAARAMRDRLHRPLGFLSIRCSASSGRDQRQEIASWMIMGAGSQQRDGHDQGLPLDGARQADARRPDARASELDNTSSSRRSRSRPIQRLAGPATSRGEREVFGPSRLLPAPAGQTRRAAEPAAPAGSEGGQRDPSAASMGVSTCRHAAAARDAAPVLVQREAIQEPKSGSTAYTSGWDA